MIFVYFSKFMYKKCYKLYSVPKAAIGVINLTVIEKVIMLRAVKVFFVEFQSKYMISSYIQEIFSFEKRY